MIATNQTLSAAAISGGSCALGANFIAPNDPGIRYSPANWDVTEARAFSINAGATFCTLFTGGKVTLLFDISELSPPFPQLSYRIDGYGPRTVFSPAAKISLMMPPDTKEYGRHLLDVRIKSTSELLNRWHGLETGVRLTGLQLDKGAVLTLPGAAPLSGIAYGDSITEGVRTVNTTAIDDTDRNDSGQSWAFELGRLLGAEIGIIGFGGSGLVVTGTGAVPPLPQTYNFISNDIKRSFPDDLDFIVLNLGTNDGMLNTFLAMKKVLNGLLSTIPPNTKIIVLRPFINSIQSNHLQSAIAACTAPARVTFVDTAGFFDVSNSPDSLHPYGSENLAVIAPKVAAAIWLVLTARPDVNATPSKHRLGIRSLISRLLKF